MWTSCTKYFTNFLIGNASFISFQNLWIYSRSKLWKKMTEIKGISGSRFGENTQVHDLVRIPSGPHNLHRSYSTVTMVTTRANVQHEEKVKKRTNKQAICFMRKTWVLHAITFFGTLVRQRERHNKQSSGFMSKTRVLHVNDVITLFGTTSLWHPFHKYDMKLPSVLMRRFLKDVITTRRISCLFLNLDIFIKNSIP